MLDATKFKINQHDLRKSPVQPEFDLVGRYNRFVFIAFRLGAFESYTQSMSVCQHRVPEELEGL